MPESNTFNHFHSLAWRACWYRHKSLPPHSTNKHTHMLSLHKAETHTPTLPPQNRHTNTTTIPPSSSNTRTYSPTMKQKHLKVQSFGFWVSGSGLGFRVTNFGLRVSGFGFQHAHLLLQPRVLPSYLWVCVQAMLVPTQGYLAHEKLPPHRTLQ